MPDIRAIADADEARELMAEIGSASEDLVVGDDRCVDALSSVSRTLRRTTNAPPAWQALAYWLREAPLRSALDQMRIATPPDRHRVPRGIIFHVPPTNVDTMAIYTWALACLAGNGSIVRISTRATGATKELVAAVMEALDRHPGVKSSVRFVTYGHEDDITREFSRADLRMLWGGDSSVQSLKRVPSDPRSLDLPFVDRFSLAAFKASAILSAPSEALREVVHGLWNDAYWFDQMGCSSPRCLVFVGNDSEAGEAEQTLLDALADYASRRGYLIPPSAVMEKFVSAVELLGEGRAATARFVSPHVTSALLVSGELPRQTPGGGFFSTIRTPLLRNLADDLIRKDQTLTHFGFAKEELTELVEACRSRTPDRIVPVGAALAFDFVWDGINLLDLMTRTVTCR